MGKPTSPNKVGIITFKFGKEVFILQDASHQTAVYPSLKLAINEIAMARKRAIEDGGMVSMLSEMLFDFRAHSIIEKELPRWQDLMAGEESNNVSFGYLNGLKLTNKAAKTIHDYGDEAKPRFKPLKCCIRNCRNDGYCKRHHRINAKVYP
jgi:hypothetical protein